MKRSNVVLLVLVFLACVTGSFLATYLLHAEVSSLTTTSAQGAEATLGNWLGLEVSQRESVSALEQAYKEDRQSLESELDAERETLADMFDSAAVTNEVFLTQVERVIAASNALERRTATFLVAVRPFLNSDQQHKLFQHFATGIREGGKHGWRHGQQRNGVGGRGRGGPPPGRGPGRGDGKDRGQGTGHP